MVASFLPTWPGSSLILDTHWTSSPSMSLYTDISGSEGLCAFWCGWWLQAGSPAQSIKLIFWKELFAIVNTVNTWGVSMSQAEDTASLQQ